MKVGLGIAIFFKNV